MVSIPVYYAWRGLSVLNAYGNPKGNYDNSQSTSTVHSPYGRGKVRHGGEAVNTNPTPWSSGLRRNDGWEADHFHFRILPRQGHGGIIMKIGSARIPRPYPSRVWHFPTHRHSPALRRGRLCGSRNPGSRDVGGHCESPTPPTPGFRPTPEFRTVGNDGRCGPWIPAYNRNDGGADTRIIFILVCGPQGYGYLL